MKQQRAAWGSQWSFLLESMFTASQHRQFRMSLRSHYRCGYLSPETSFWSLEAGRVQGDAVVWLPRC